MDRSSIIRQTTLLTLLMAAGVALLLFSLKYQVLDLERELTGLNDDIAADRQALHVLRAEWSLLNDPLSLRGLASKHLGMVPIEARQFSSMGRLPMREDARESPSSAASWTSPAERLRR